MLQTSNLLCCKLKHHVIYHNSLWQIKLFSLLRACIQVKLCLPQFVVANLCLLVVFYKTLGWLRPKEELTCWLSAQGDILGRWVVDCPRCWNIQNGFRNNKIRTKWGNLQSPMSGQPPLNVMTPNFKLRRRTFGMQCCLTSFRVSWHRSVEAQNYYKGVFVRTTLINL